MATWTDIPQSALEPDSPARAIDAQALRDNPVAIAEGAAGAPRTAQLTANDSFFVTGGEWDDVPSGEKRTLFDLSGEHILLGGTLTAIFEAGPGFDLIIDGVTFTYNGQGLSEGTSIATSIPSARCKSSIRLDVINLRNDQESIKASAYLMEV